MKKLLLRYFPFLYRLRVKQLTIKRCIHNLNPKIKFSFKKTGDSELYCFIYKKHKSILRKVLGNTDPMLQENKINNLRIALKEVDGIIIQPGETFSFWKLVGKATKNKGYMEGLMLSNGEVKTGIGGGLCQLANMLFWLAIHTPLEVKERHHHSFDIFPDDRRTIPFGTGTSVFYNYVDLQFYNPTDFTFQFRIWLSDEFLEGTIGSDIESQFVYKIEERNHKFYQNNHKWFRENEIWRLVIDQDDNMILHEEFLIGNHAEVKYIKSS